MKSLTSVRGLGRAELTSLIHRAVEYTTIEMPLRVLADRSVATLFFERSTRTRLSFQLAAEKLGAHVLDLDPTTSSTGKGESLRDTVMTVSAIGADIFVVRHAEPGIPDLVADWTGAPVVNAGDGTREHPTQALVDLVTMKRHFGSLQGLRMGVVGDIRHSRVAGSLFHAMPTMGVELTAIGPPEFLPSANTEGVTVTTDLEAILGDLDVVYLLRVQTERGATVDDSYAEHYGLDARRAALLSESTMVMHPGPLNRGVEISDEVADGPRSLILQQVANGVPVRMAVLASLEESLV
jgi:aspartate carbamoyltransferase catalytic subunit